MPSEPPEDSDEVPLIPDNEEDPELKGLPELEAYQFPDEIELSEDDEKKIASIFVESDSPAAVKEEVKIEVDSRTELARLSIQKRALENQSFSDDIQARGTYAEGIFKLIIWWLAAILVILILQGFLSKREIAIEFPAFGSQWKTAIHFELPDSVLLALIGGTSASVLGLFAIVANYFFPKKP